MKLLFGFTNLMSYGARETPAAVIPWKSCNEAYVRELSFRGNVTLHSSISMSTHREKSECRKERLLLPDLIHSVFISDGFVLLSLLF